MADDPVMEPPCWSCTDKVRSGYRINFYLQGSDLNVPTGTIGPYLSMALCWPCFKTLSRVMGEQGKAALRQGAMSDEPKVL